MLAGCGGGGGNYTPSPTPPPTPGIAKAGPPNAEPVVVDGGPAGLMTPSVNTAFVSVKICAPGSTSNCQVIDHIEVDTGSIGLRIISSVLTVALPVESDSNNLLAECLTFADNTVAWGSIGVADVTMPTSGETATSVNVQVIGSTAAGSVPAACSGSNTVQDTVESFGANGILGVGPFPTDCNDGPCTPGSSATYYSCPTASSCAQFTASETEQLQNPVTGFTTDNNGSILELPAIAATGAASPSGGVLVFGVNTQSNNSSTGATVLYSDPNSGVISAQFLGTTYPESYLDSGSNANFINGTGAATCSDGEFLCPTATLSESAQLIGTSGDATVSFDIANADSLFSGNPSATAYNNLGAAGFDQSSLDLGLPFFFGQNVYLGIESTTQDPYYGFIAN